jgi:hypothetical protein
MLIQHFLDLARPDLEPRGDDHVLGTIDEIKPACLVPEPDVAGAQLAVAQRLGRLLRLLPVARNDLRAGDHQLANLAGPGVVAGIGDDADVGVEHRNAD